MPGWDHVIDPITQDFVETEAGELETTRGARTALYCQLVGHHNRWVGDPAAGSRLHTLERKLSLATVRVARDMVEEAVKPLEDAGMLVGYKLTTDRDPRGKLVLFGSAVDAEGGEFDITPLLPGGV